MKAYRVIRTCTYPGRGYLEEGSIVKLEDHEIPSRHFALVSEDKIVMKAIVEPMAESYSGIQKQQSELSKPKAGFASNISKLEPEVKDSKSSKKK